MTRASRSITLSVVRFVLVLLLLTGCARSEPQSGPAPCCVSSAPAPSTSAVTSSATPEAAWSALLAAMRAGDVNAMARYATADGIASLDRGVTGEDRLVAFKRWGGAWAKWEIRFGKRDDARAEAALGPEVKEHGLTFVRTSDGWKLDRWQPGE